MSNEIIVCGAGVIGLTCAYNLVLKGHENVRIVSKVYPSTGSLKPEYTSSKSGAHSRPSPAQNAQQLRDGKLARVTYEVFKKLSSEFPESSIKFMEGIDYLENSDPLYEGLGEGYTEGVENFKVLSKSELPSGVKFGASYTAWSVNSPKYLLFLEEKLRLTYGIVCDQLEVTSLKQVKELYSPKTIINCTGMGLQYDGSWDPDCFPIRGQTLLVRAPLDCVYHNKTVTYQLANGQWCFVIPRPLDGGIIVGGTKVPYNTTAVPLDNETHNLVSNAVERFPELLINGKLDIKRVNVGFRPARKNGVKIGKKVIDGVTIIDCYGFGGSGVENSWGASGKVVELVEDMKSKL